MSTTELDMSAGAGAVPAAEQDETALPEQQTAGDAHQQTETDESADQSSDEGGDKLTPEQRTIKKLESRIARLAGKRGAAEREVALLRQELAQFRNRDDGRQGDDGETGSRQLTESDIERLARERAKQLVKEQAVSVRAGKVLEEGSKLDGFFEAVDTVAEILGVRGVDGKPSFRDRQGQLVPAIEAIFDSDNPAQLLKHLGDNPEEAEELADLTPAQLGRRIAKLEIKLGSAKKQTSAAPTPIRPVGGNHAGSVEPDPDKDPEAWIRARNRAAVRAS